METKEVLPDQTAKAEEEENDENVDMARGDKTEEVVDLDGDQETGGKDEIGDKGADDKADDDLPLPPPSPPRRGSQTGQKLKRWSKMIKYYSQPKSSNASASQEQSTQSEQKLDNGSGLQRKSLKERLTDGELAVFLRERRAVSESRFRILDRIAGSSTSNLGDQESLIRTKSDPKVNESSSVAPKRSKKKAASSDSEREHGINPPKTKKGSNKDGNNSTSPEEKSDAEKKKGKGKGRSRSKDKRGRHGNKKKHSTCSACNHDNDGQNGGQGLSKKDKKRQQKNKDKKIIGEAPKDNTGKDVELLPEIPPYPKTLNGDWTNVEGQRTQFFQKLLLKDEDKVELNEKANYVSEIKSERKPRSVLKKRPPQPSLLDSNRKTVPVLHAYLHERRIVSDSIFKRFNNVANGHLTSFPMQGEKFSHSRSIFANGAAPMATFPRSVSNLEKRSGYGELHRRKQSKSPDQNRRTDSVEGPGDENEGLQARSRSLPRRPGSGMSDRSLGHQSQLDHEEYKNYVLEMMHSSHKNPRFQQLQSYYTALDKALKLEKKSASTEVHKLKSEEVVDFETWRKLRVREKASDELDSLLRDLRAAQKSREFFFRPKEVDSVRWRGDAHLRGRDKSVENLKCHFDKIVQDQSAGGATEECKAKVADLNLVKDVYKPMWRARSVSDLAQDKLAKVKGKSTQLHQEEPREGLEAGKRFQTFPQVRPSSIGRSRSSLTAGQVNTLKDQLNDIYVSVGSSLGGGSSMASGRSSRSPSRTIGNGELVSPIRMKDTMKQLEQMDLLIKPIPDIIKRSHGKCSDDAFQGRAVSPIKNEDDIKKRLSKKIGKEIKERSTTGQPDRGTSPVMKRYLAPRDFDLRDSKPPMKFSGSSPRARETSPRTCYSLEQQMQREEEANKKDSKTNNTDFLLVLNQDASKEVEVRSVVDNWASGDESAGARKSSARKANKSSESLSSSGTSTVTVIHRKSVDKLNPVKENQDEHCRVGGSLVKRRSVEELTRSYESLERERRQSKSLSPSRPLQDVSNIHVREIKRSFEMPKAPARCASLGRADQIGPKQWRRRMEVKRSSSEDVHKRITFSPNTKYQLDQGSKTNLYSSNTSVSDKRTPSPHHYSSSDPRKYARSYLALVRSGEVLAKKGFIEERALTPEVRPVSPYRMPDIDLDYIREHLTDLSKPVVKPKEIGDVSGTKAKIEERADDWKSLVGQNLLQSGKTKLMKHISRKVGHAKILSRMMALQQGSEDIDKGAVDLFERALEEKEHFKTFRGGKVESVVDQFEGKDKAEIHSEAAQGSSFNEIDQKYPFEPNPNFSWSGRFATNLPHPRNAYTSAQKHGHFRSYYGYLPSEVAANMAKASGSLERTKNKMSQDEDSLLPPPPPKRSEDPLYSKILPKSQRKPDNDGWFKALPGGKYYSYFMFNLCFHHLYLKTACFT